MFLVTNENMGLCLYIHLYLINVMFTYLLDGRMWIYFCFSTKLKFNSRLEHHISPIIKVRCNLFPKVWIEINHWIRYQEKTITFSCEINHYLSPVSLNAKVFAFFVRIYLDCLYGLFVVFTDNLWLVRSKV